ncbi:MAG: membrane protein [Caldimonas sp.]|uniref:hypothetical protein n=1 Tax=Caldimonas manganoxidans TaxID=196015 RepID=UPI00035D48BA|nr:hypothetical protein [Caldimonas manganoxidans]GIX23539.1 MAG: membrane protein [Caldimonas sp.]
MTGRIKPVVFDPYGRRRSRRFPAWLGWLLSGAALGVAGVLYVQAEHLPARLSASESQALRAAHDAAQAERQRLTRALEETTQRLQTAEAERQKLALELAAARDTLARQRDDLQALADALPPDPRGSTVAVRAARLRASPGRLTYDLVLTRQSSPRPLQATLQFIVAGADARGSESRHSLEPLPVTLNRVDSLRGQVNLPEGFAARQATVRITDRSSGQLLGMRVLHVR